MRSNRREGLTTEEPRQAVIHTRQTLATSERRMCRGVSPTMSDPNQTHAGETLSMLDYIICER